MRILWYEADLIWAMIRLINGDHGGPTNCGNPS
jgi:hypothetical protein